MGKAGFRLLGFGSQCQAAMSLALTIPLGPAEEVLLAVRVLAMSLDRLPSTLMKPNGHRPSLPILASTS